MKSYAKKVAITGNIGSGKSTFSRILSQKGYSIINADELSKTLLATNSNIKNKIIKTFGKDSYTNEEVNKDYLIQKVFSKPTNVQKINSIVHPVVISEIKTLFNEKEGKEKIIFVEAALIYEADMEDIFDYVVLITADENTRKERKIANNSMTADEFEKRNINQIPDIEKKKRADFVFENNSSVDDLKSKAELLIILLTNELK